MAADEAMPPTRVEEADEYLRKHRILDLFNNLTSQLIYARPGTYMVHIRLMYNRIMGHIRGVSFVRKTVLTTGT